MNLKTPSINAQARHFIAAMVVMNWQLFVRGLRQQISLLLLATRGQTLSQSE
jgi:hypothetical protein